MKKSIFLSLILATNLSVNNAANAAIIEFFTDQATFEAELNSSTTIDFEGIVADSAFGAPDANTTSPSIIVDGITFSTSTTLGIAGANSPVNGAPYDSAILFSNNGRPITIDFTSAGSEFNAVGGIFGDINSTSSATLSLFGVNGLLSTQNISVGDMGAGLAKTFFGFTVDESVTSLTFDTTSNFEGIDNIIMGQTSANPVSTSGSLSLLIGGLGLLAFSRRSKK